MARLDREVSRRYDRRRYLATRKWMRRIKNRPCQDCGGNFPVVCMEFDHVRDKKLFPIGNRLSLCREKLQAEIAKCDVVCANCHAIRTDQRRKSG